MVSHQNLPFRVSSCLLRCHPLLPGRKDRAGFDLLTTSSSLQRQVTSRNSSKTHKRQPSVKTTQNPKKRPIADIALFDPGTDWPFWSRGLFAGGTGGVCGRKEKAKLWRRERLRKGMRVRWGCVPRKRALLIGSGGVVRSVL